MASISSSAAAAGEDLKNVEEVMKNLEIASQSDLMKKMPNFDKKLLVECLNKLIVDRKIEILQDKQQNLFYKYKENKSNQKNFNQQELKQLKDLKFSDQYEKMVYEIIESSSNLGIWIRDIRIRSSLNTAVLNKVIASLVTKKYIKLINSVSASTKKLYMLYDLEPDQSISGGTFFTDQQLDTNLVESLLLHSHQYLQSKRFEEFGRIDNFNRINNQNNNNPKNIQLPSVKMMSCDIESVHCHLSDLKLTTKSLKIEDVEQILNLLVFDRKALSIEIMSKKYYYSTENPVQNKSIECLPCMFCPNIDDCRIDESSMNAIGCKMLNDWLKFD